MNVERFWMIICTVVVLTGCAITVISIVRLAGRSTDERAREDFVSSCTAVNHWSGTKTYAVADTQTKPWKCTKEAAQ
jgi:hypothetical protein